MKLQFFPCARKVMTIPQFLHACFCLFRLICPLDSIASRFPTSEIKSSKSTRLHTPVSYLLANQQAFSHEQATKGLV